MEGQGTLMSLIGVGSFAVTFILATIPSRNRGRILLISNLFMGISMVIFAFSTLWPLSMVMMVLIGIGRMGADTCGNTLIQSYTDPAILGRVNSVLMFSIGLGGTGSFFIGLLAEAIGAPWALDIFAIILVVVSISAITLVSTLRKLN